MSRSGKFIYVQATKLAQMSTMNERKLFHPSFLLWLTSSASFYRLLYFSRYLRKLTQYSPLFQYWSGCCAAWNQFGRLQYWLACKSSRICTPTRQYPDWFCSGLVLIYLYTPVNIWKANADNEACVSRLYYYYAITILVIPIQTKTEYSVIWHMQG